MFIQHATGQFSIEVGGHNHCGPDDSSPKTFTYDVKVTYPDNALNERGFLIDNLEFPRYFKGLGYTDESCERMAEHAADYFCTLAPQAYEVKVDIAVPGLADIEYDETPRPDRRPLAAEEALRMGLKPLTSLEV